MFLSSTPDPLESVNNVWADMWNQNANISIKALDVITVKLCCVPQVQIPVRAHTHTQSRLVLKNQDSVHTYILCTQHRMMNVIRIMCLL